MTDLKKWTTAAAGNTLSPPDGAPEGWAPADVNNWGRETMASVARWYRDAEWIDYDHTPTFVTASSFTIQGDHTEIYTTGRRIRADDGGNQIKGDVLSQSFNGATTTVSLLLDGPSLTSSMSAVSVGIIEPVAGGIKLDFSSSTTTFSAINVTNITITDIASISAAVINVVTINNTLTVSGTATFLTNVFIGGNLTVSGTAVIENLYVPGTTTLSGDVTMKSNLSIGAAGAGNAITAQGPIVVAQSSAWLEVFANDPTLRLKDEFHPTSHNQTWLRQTGSNPELFQIQTHNDADGAVDAWLSVELSTSGAANITFAIGGNDAVRIDDSSGIGQAALDGTMSLEFLRVFNQAGLSLTGVAHGFQIGNANSRNMRFADDAIQNVNAGSASVIDLNPKGGDVQAQNQSMLRRISSSTGGDGFMEMAWGGTAGITPDEITMQWGTESIPASGTAMAFPTPFNTTPFAFVATCQTTGTGQGDVRTVSWTSLSAGGVNVNVWRPSADPILIAGTILWFAIGPVRAP